MSGSHVFGMHFSNFVSLAGSEDEGLENVGMAQT